MKYVFDSGPLIDLKHYYSGIFKSFWSRFDQLINDGTIISVREVYNEISGRNDFVSEWAKKNKSIFLTPDFEELTIVQDILAKHPELIKMRNLNNGKPVADPFVIAKAVKEGLIVVSTELYAPNAHKIPNICSEYRLKHFNFSNFLNNEGWIF